jgi:hypothetical protein
MKTNIFTFALAVLLASTPVQAQSAGFGMGFAGGYVDIGGGDLSEVQGGFGVDFALRYRLNNGLSFGGGAEIAWPGSAVDEVIEPSFTDFQLVAVFFEPRYNFLFPVSRISPFIGARVSYSRLNFNVFMPGEELPLTADSDGVEYGGSAGIEVWLTEGVAVTVAGQVSGLSFGDVKVSPPIPDLPEKLGNGSKFAIIAGIELLFL